MWVLFSATLDTDSNEQLVQSTQLPIFVLRRRRRRRRRTLLTPTEIHLNLKYGASILGKKPTTNKTTIVHVT